MKAKKEFYLYGNDRKFHDDYIVSIMTEEPMPKKWQQFLELTPEEKARWDASLRLDAEYRIAEAQGFPNGIPGGKTRGNALYTFTQMEEERERNLLKNQREETLNPYGQYFLPHKTDMHDNISDMFGNIAPADNLWQNPFDTRKTNLTAGISAPSAPQTENKPAFDLRQAIQRLTESVRASMNHANQQMQTNEAENKHLSYTGDSPIPATYDRQQTMNNAVPKQTSPQEKNEPSQFYAEEQTETQDEVPWMTCAIYDAEKEAPPQEHYILPNLAAIGLLPQNENTAVYAKQYSVAAKHNRPYTHKKASPQRSMTNTSSQRNLMTSSDVSEKNQEHNNHLLSSIQNIANNAPNSYTLPNRRPTGSQEHTEEGTYKKSNLRSIWTHRVYGIPMAEDSYSLLDDPRQINDDHRISKMTAGLDADAEVHGLGIAKEARELWKGYNKWVAELEEEERAAINLLTDIALDVAEAIVPRIPYPPVRIPATILLISITVYRSAVEIKKEWLQEVDQYVKKENCSYDEAKKQLRPLLFKLTLEKVMEKVSTRWLDQYLKDDGMPEFARIFITQDWTAALESMQKSK